MIKPIEKPKEKYPSPEIVESVHSRSYLSLPPPPKRMSRHSNISAITIIIPRITFIIPRVLAVQKVPTMRSAALSGQRYGAILTITVKGYFSGIFLLMLSTSEAIYSPNSGVRMRMSCIRPSVKRPMPT